VLEYLNVPHDVEVRSVKRELLRASLKPGDTAEGSPDHLGEDLVEVASNDSAGTELKPASLSTVQDRPALIKASDVSLTNTVSEPVPPPQSVESQRTKQREGTVVVEIGPFVHR
jgi:hypothetical protein